MKQRILLFATMTFLFSIFVSGCGKQPAGSATTSTDLSVESSTEATKAVTATSMPDTIPETTEPATESLDISQDTSFIPVASGLNLVPYSNTEFSINLPEGWMVEAAPMTAGMSHVFWAYDPACPVNQLLYAVKFEPLFVSEDARAYMSYTAGLTYGAASQEAYAACPVLSNPSTEGFFQVFSDFAAATELSCSIMGSSIQLPRIQDFSVSERFPAQGGMSSVAVSPELLRASFSQNGLEGEGLFSANVVPFAADMYGYYMAYDILLMSAEKDQFQNWEGLLTQSLQSLTYTDEFIRFATAQSDQQVATSQYLSQSASEMSDSILSAWDTRNKSEDILRQKQSDATMGYERILDTETGDIYQTDNGFTDWYDGTRYQPISDEQYTDAVKGVYHWK